MLLVLGLIAALALASLLSLRYWVRRDVEERVTAQLEAAERVAGRFLRARAERLAVSCAATAAAPRFRAVIEAADRRSIEDTGRDEMKVVGADLLLVTGKDGRELGRIAPAALPERRGVVDAGLKFEAGTDVWPVGGQLYHVASQPVTFDGSISAVVTLGRRLDHDFAVELGGVTGTTAVIDPPGDGTASAKDQESRVREVPLRDRSGAVVGRVVLMRSLDQALAFLHRIQMSLAMAACLVSLAGLGLTALFGRALTRPLSELMRSTEELAAGRFDLPVPVSSSDELGLLAARFEEMRRSLKANIQRLVEEERQRHQMEIERHRSLSQMVAGVAHEINTPLGIVNSAASIFTETLTPSGVDAMARDDDARTALTELTEAARLIQNNIARADHLIQSFKNLSVRQVSDAIGQVDLPALVDQIVGLFRIQAKQARIQVAIANRLSEPTWTGYPGFFSQILLNLLSNTARYAYPGNTGGQVEVELEDAPDGKIALTVRDHGAGIAPENLSRVFDVFFTTGRGQGGSGLGLAIVNNLVREELRGTVDVQSKQGEGTTFRVVLPRVVAPR